MGNCRRKGAVMLPLVTIIVGRNDRNVGGRQLQPGLGDRSGGQSADLMLPEADSESRLQVDAADQVRGRRRWQRHVGLGGSSDGSGGLR